MFRIASVSVCALALLLVGTARAQLPSATQYDYTVRGMSSGWYGGSSGYSGGFYNSNYYVPANQGLTYESGYQPEPIPADAALIDMKVPANAEVWFSGEKTTQRGADRSFVTPELNRDGKYAYQIKARWTDEDGKVVEREKRVPVRAGDRLNVNFN
jgi:uncharacterized protein (TIGR03000 family)